MLLNNISEAVKEAVDKTKVYLCTKSWFTPEVKEDKELI